MAEGMFTSENDQKLVDDGNFAVILDDRDPHGVVILLRKMKETLVAAGHVVINTTIRQVGASNTQADAIELSKMRNTSSKPIHGIITIECTINALACYRGIFKLQYEMAIVNILYKDILE